MYLHQAKLKMALYRRLNSFYEKPAPSAKQHVKELFDSSYFLTHLGRNGRQ